MKKIGIIGGAGPEAGATLFMEIIREYQRNGRVEDQDFPYITLLNIPFAPMLTPEAMQENKSTIIQQLLNGLDALKGHDAVGIACNTLHTLLPEIDTSQTRLISIVSATADEIRANARKKCLFLGTSTSVRSNLYGAVPGIIYPTDEEQSVVDTAIANILAGRFTDSHRIKTIIQRARLENSIDGVILGCTELPLLHAQTSLIVDEIPVFNTLKVLAQQLARQD